jgi:hypothetical protein
MRRPCRGRDQFHVVAICPNVEHPALFPFRQIGGTGRRRQHGAVVDGNAARSKTQKPKGRDPSHLGQVPTITRKVAADLGITDIETGANLAPLFPRPCERRCRALASALIFGAPAAQTGLPVRNFRSAPVRHRPA